MKNHFDLKKREVVHEINYVFIGSNILESIISASVVPENLVQIKIHL